MQALVDSLVSGTVELVFRLCATYGLCVSCEEIDRSPLANSMPIRVTGRCTVDWSGQGVGSYIISECPVFRMDSPLVLCRVVRLHTSMLSVGLVATSCGLLYALGQQ